MSADIYIWQKWKGWWTIDLNNGVWFFPGRLTQISINDISARDSWVFSIVLYEQYSYSSGNVHAVMCCRIHYWIELFSHNIMTLIFISSFRIASNEFCPDSLSSCNWFVRINNFLMCAHSRRNLIVQVGRVELRSSGNLTPTHLTFGPQTSFSLILYSRVRLKLPKRGKL